ncbi:MAG: thiol peroxidase [Chloroflexi bacterium]|nr:MAG: thiol peroxidase [Chloroflexota bacterium]MBL1195851.1 thiol peroxidase [Chloroflexota bacterium]NOH13143.1 thiol peroxidase [Chloroflexota bacterium]
MEERNDFYKLGDNFVTIVGSDIEVGQKAPEFTVQDQTFADLGVLDATKGKVRILAAVPSLSTSVCDRETRRFNEEAASLSDEIAIVTISADLPFTLKSWCGAAGVDQVLVVSDHMDAEFGMKYGTLVKERRILRRAVFVVDKDDKVVYSDYMASLGDEPDYEAVLEAAKGALN